MKTGQIEYVEDCLQRIDHTLSTWEGYLTAACRYFTKKGLFSVLYRTQLFMKVGVMQNFGVPTLVNIFWVGDYIHAQYKYTVHFLLDTHTTIIIMIIYITYSIKSSMSICSYIFFPAQDYIRAGMTCIKFFIGFSGRVTSIADLFSRLHYLSQAKKHFQTYIEVNRRIGDRRGGWSRSSRQYEDSSQVLLSSVKTLDMSEVQQHLATIEMQTRVCVILVFSVNDTYMPFLVRRLAS